MLNSPYGWIGPFPGQQPATLPPGSVRTGSVIFQPRTPPAPPPGTLPPTGGPPGPPPPVVAPPMQMPPQQPPIMHLNPTQSVLPGRNPMGSGPWNQQPFVSPYSPYLPSARPRPGARGPLMLQ